MSGGSTTQPMQAWVDPELKRATPGSPGIAWPHPHFCLGAPRQAGTGPGPTCEVAEAGGGGVWQHRPCATLMEQMWTNTAKVEGQKTATNCSGFIKSVCFSGGHRSRRSGTFCSAVLSTWAHHTAQNGFSSTRHPSRLRGRKRRGREARPALHRDGRRPHLAAGSPGSPAALLRTKVGRSRGHSAACSGRRASALLVLRNRTPQGLLGFSDWNSRSTCPLSCWTLRHAPVSGCSALTSSRCWAASRRGLMGHLTCLPSRSLSQCLYSQSLGYSHRNTASRSHLPQVLGNLSYMGPLLLNSCTCGPRSKGSASNAGGCGGGWGHWSHFPTLGGRWAVMADTTWSHLKRSPVQPFQNKGEQ